ncbi:MAG: REP-associated tyrosine transposase [Bacillota bacterium]
MPRIARIKEKFSTYHIMVRGNERKNIFFDNSDKEMYLQIIDRVKKKYKFFIYSYCLMNNHAHLIIDDNGNDISQIMKSIGTSYVTLFNRKHQRIGHLFQDRFKSRLIDNNEYLLEVSKYIHNNPVKAGITRNPQDYPWSSYRGIITGEDMGLVDGFKILQLMSNNKDKAIVEYKKYMKEKESEIEKKILSEEGFFLPLHEKVDFIKNKQQGQQKLQEIANNMEISLEDLINTREFRDMAIKKIREKSTLTLKEIGEIVGGISESRVSRVLRAN